MTNKTTCKPSLISAHQPEDYLQALLRYRTNPHKSRGIINTHAHSLSSSSKKHTHTHTPNHTHRERKQTHNHTHKDTNTRRDTLTPRRHTQKKQQLQQPEKWKTKQTPIQKKRHCTQAHNNIKEKRTEREHTNRDKERVKHIDKFKRR
jgi:hypothetical protein